MSRAIDEYVSDSPAINQLIQLYGDRLQRLSFYERLLTIMTIAAALSDGFLDANADISVERQVRSYLSKGYRLDRDLDCDLVGCLIELDECDEEQVTALLVALIGYVSDELVQIAISY